jgi:hypothetical protein
MRKLRMKSSTTLGRTCVTMRVFVLSCPVRPSGEPTADVPGSSFADVTFWSDASAVARSSSSSSSWCGVCRHGGVVRSSRFARVGQWCVAVERARGAATPVGCGQFESNSARACGDALRGFQPFRTPPPIGSPTWTRRLVRDGLLRRRARHGLSASRGGDQVKMAAPGR